MRSLQDAVADPTADIHAERVLELGVGTGQTSRPGVLDVHPEAELVGIDENGDARCRVRRRRRRSSSEPSPGPTARGQLRRRRVGACRAPPRW